MSVSTMLAGPEIQDALFGEGQVATITEDTQPQTDCLCTCSCRSSSVKVGNANMNSANLWAGSMPTG
jgi:hypothetical protein